MKRFIFYFALSLSFLNAAATERETDLGVFPLSDATGKTWKLSNEDFNVFIEVGSKCPIVRMSAPTIRALAEKYQKKNVRFFLLNSSAHDSAKSALKEAEDFKINLPVLMDVDQKMAKALDLNVTAESVLIHEGKVIYRGALDDSITYEGRKSVTNAYLEKAIDAALLGKAAPVEETRTYGCLITFKQADSPFPKKDQNK